MKPFDFTANYSLENDRVLLRPLLAEDFDHLLEFSLQEPEIWLYSLVSGNGEENLKNYIRLALEKRKQADSYPYIVYDKKYQNYAGTTRFYDFQKTHNTVQLGYTWYGKEFQGTGLNKQCKYLLLSFAFEELGVHRVEFRADNNNARSIAAMKSIGCVPEGVLRSNCASVGGRRDSIIFSILQHEWKSHVKKEPASESKVKINHYI